MTAMNAASEDALSLSEEVAERVLIELAKRRMSQRELGRQLEKGHNWVHLRTSGQQQWTVDDVDMVAHELGVSLADLLGIESAYDELPLEVDQVMELWKDEMIPDHYKRILLKGVGQARRFFLEMFQAPREPAMRQKART